MPKLNKRLICLYLDILSFPGVFMSKKDNALWHLKHVCPKCPDWRRKMRETKSKKNCLWYDNWKKRNYSIPKSFGFKNFILQHMYLKTDLYDIKEVI